MEKPNLYIRILKPEVDTLRLQEVLEAAPRYSFNVSGRPQPPNAAEEVFSALPDGFVLSGKFVFGIELGTCLIGCIDLLRGYPRPETAMVGLLLLRESHQGKGYGQGAYLQLEDKLREWPEIKTVRISVVESNGEVLRFWEKLGFAEIGVRRPYQNGEVSSEAMVLEKAL